MTIHFSLSTFELGNMFPGKYYVDFYIDLSSPSCQLKNTMKL